DEILRRLPTVSHAAFNTFDRQDKPLCVEGTRVGVLQEILSWLSAKRKQSIFWLSGIAGIGKSTVARTICVDLNTQGRLGTSFFFDRGPKGVSNASKFLTTIAYQLAVKHPGSIWDSIVEAAKAFPTDITLSLRQQWQLLIRDSFLDQTVSSKALLVVVDALDECEDEFSARTMISLFSSTAELPTIDLRIIVTSRPEAAIRTKFSKPGICTTALHCTISLQ
ncbi:hypothetical protein K461DRAFT_302338, partial [Myriangium duriaei CBS 260.36]